MHSSLYKKSIEIILENQSKWGSFIACPTFPTYHYSWLRDGSFIAHAMDCAGETESAAAFYRWLGKTIETYGNKLENLRRITEAGEIPGKDDALHTRFTMDGKEDFQDETWGNFQVDGYGTWLWALHEHVKISGNTAIVQELSEAINITVEYLSLVWQFPNYDCWEEYPEYIHTYSLGCVYGGFRAVADMENQGWLEPAAINASDKAEEVKAFILNYAVVNQRLAKMIEPAEMKADAEIGVDASLLGLLWPYAVFEFDNDISIATLKRIETNLLRTDGGIYRYGSDEYYGGGEWILLTAWLGWVYARTGKLDEAKKLQSWIESCADEENQLPEQVNENPILPHRYQPWVEKWGLVAKPLLWSHAMYIVLVHEIDKGNQND